MSPSTTKTGVQPSPLHDFLLNLFFYNSSQMTESSSSSESPSCGEWRRETALRSSSQFYNKYYSRTSIFSRSLRHGFDVGADVNMSTRGADKETTLMRAFIIIKLPYEDGSITF